MRIDAAYPSQAMGNPDHGAAPAATGRPDRASEASAGGSGTDHVELSEEARREVDRLKKVDAQVRAHEQAHMTAGGANISGGATFEFTRGPDGRQYAVGGEVSIDTSPVQGNPQATLRKAQAIARAALAPMEPSAQDRAVAAQAAQMEAQARMEMSRESNAGAKSSPDRSARHPSGPLERYASVMAGNSPPSRHWTA